MDLTTDSTTGVMGDTYWPVTHAWMTPIRLEKLSTFPFSTVPNFCVDNRIGVMGDTCHDPIGVMGDTYYPRIGVMGDTLIREIYINNEMDGARASTVDNNNPATCIQIPLKSTHTGQRSPSALTGCCLLLSGYRIPSAYRLGSACRWSYPSGAEDDNNRSTGRAGA